MARKVLLEVNRGGAEREKKKKVEGQRDTRNQ